MGIEADGRAMSALHVRLVFRQRREAMPGRGLAMAGRG